MHESLPPDVPELQSNVILDHMAYHILYIMRLNLALCPLTLTIVASNGLRMITCFP